MTCSTSYKVRVKFSRIDLRSGYRQLRECMKKIFQRLALGRGNMRFQIEVVVRAAEGKYFVIFQGELWLQECIFLVHVINSNGIHMDPIKIEAMKN
ncbi:hypothetical protein Tco_0839304 [Tanacetum coccineum]|uniref:Uncharacterized protein n=1 Tax=Tanacetum coccineum TaxID=301880 RepID=A0ABQ5ATE8_9ASTR